jgi:FAD/FMN-containing dehydrogenase
MLMTAPAVSETAYDLGGFRAAIGGVEIIDEPGLVRLKSRDFFWYSPVLKAALDRKAADIVVVPRSEAEVARVARAAARHRVPLTPRGGGTGNYGQAVPLAGGAVLDLTRLDAIEWTRPGAARVAAGRKLVDIDDALRPGGWELRMFPSTKRTATIGGFVAGGSGGVGSITYGGLREAGNVLAARIVTVEDEPRIIELRDDETSNINHAWGTTGIITALEIPLAPAWNWIDVVVAIDDFAGAVRLGHRAALADGIVKKLLTPLAWPIPSFFRHFKNEFPPGRDCLIAMIAEPSLASFKALVAREGGEIAYCAPTADGPGARPLYECAWNHTTLHALKVDRRITYLQARYPADRLEETVAEIAALFPDEVMLHLEFQRSAGRVTAGSLPLVRYTTRERLAEIIALHEARGVMIANPHVYTIEDSSRYKRADADQLGFKRQVDPYGLLNPGKMRSFAPPAM